MESSPDWSSVAADSSNVSFGYSIVHSPPFTFLVGPSHTKLTIQSGLARHVSKPLDHLMNSGLTRESKHHIAVLEEEDVETFVAFTEYAYTGDYNVPPPGFREDERHDDVGDPQFKGMFSNPFASAVPPPAPSPPESVKHFVRDQEVREDEGPKPERKEEEEQQQQPQVEQGGEEEEAKQENNSASDDHVAPGELLQDPVAAVDQSSGQPPATPAAEEGDPWGFTEETAPSKGKKGKKNKKDKKNKKGAGPTEEVTANLTPPTTPPPENPKDGIISDPALETSAVAEEPLQVIEPTETCAVEEAVEIPEPTEDDNAFDTVAPAMDAEPWVPTDSIPPEMKDVPQAEVRQEDNIQQEERSREEVVFPRSQMNPFIDTSFAKQHFPLRRPTGVGLWDEFTAIDYVDHRSMYGTRPLTPVSARSESSKSDLPYLVFHAKVYVFAVRYLIPALAQLCLRKLHADLLSLSFPDPKMDNRDPERIALTTSKARIVLDLLHYTYTKTTRLEPISPTSATQLRDNELRKLVVHYAACKVRDLAEYCPPMESMLGSPLASPVDKRPGRADRPSSRGFRALLDSTTELASDLVYRMM
ncbi:uncharacterized protein ACLA_057980 [Aspergillus clavatus NRRL 1]|uniref:BTB domain-containing protein n=1 Tax=Aspergillus clavatus (strain ATCC 1007 / CBS 513.65 / DSM 816 / NCTC 3887 / NRRL 1 / QM 1276 / 107) TaxID=344612 RepID=A1C401_ASPCL|nr:uncharacterized protein ACLA_057980 [Aspergillus clavatus NRRL 1]EAW15141.1 conserved hypothetical protein [Aspergillus clavatus NRRL 1]